MITHMYSVYDSVSAVYGVPFFALNDAVAIRSFVQLVHDKQCTIHMSPHDYSLHVVGSYDDIEGTVISCPSRRIYTAIRCMAPDNLDDDPYSPTYGQVATDER